MIITAGSTNVSVNYYIVQDASATSTGEPITGLVFSDIETGGSASYARLGAARVDLTLITLASASAAHADGGFIEIDATNMPGTYRCDYPDAAFASGVVQTTCQIVVASANNAVASPIFVSLTAVDLQDNVRGGMTALPNAAADAVGGLPISDAGGLDLDSRLDADVSSRLASADITLSAGVVESNLLQMGGVVQSATDLKDFADAGYDPATNKVEGVKLADTLTTYTGDTPQTADHTAGIADIPTVAEFNARTLLAASYFDPAADAVALVTDVTTKTGYALSSAGDQSIADLILPPTNTAFPNLNFLFVAASDHVTPVTSATGTAVTRSIDSGAFGAGTGTLAEVGNGIYQYDASAADMNGAMVTFRFTGTGGTPGAPDDAFVTVKIT